MPVDENHPFRDELGKQERDNDNDRGFSVSTSSRDKDENIQRKVLPKDVRDYVSERDGLRMWDIAPTTLKEYAQNLFVEAFIDQISKDVSKAEWTVTNETGEEQNEEAVGFLENLHYRFSWKDLIEATVRELLETGNAFWVLHEYEDRDEIAEAVVPDSRSMFIHTDEQGFIDGYVQRNSGREGELIPSKNVIHFTWSSSSDRYYSKGAVEMSLNEIEILDELTQKEVLDLREGAQTGIISIKDTNMGSEQVDEFIDEVTRKNEGERHEVSAVEADVDFVPMSSNYQELQILKRYAHHIEALSSAFKVSPSYVGFNFATSGGIGQGEARAEERENHREGVNTVLSQLEDQINRGLISQKFENSKFKFETTDEDERSEAEYYSTLANAVQGLRQAGIPVRIEEDRVVLPENVELDAIDMDTAEQIEEAGKLIEFDEREVETEPVSKPQQLEECVESVLDDNPDLSKSEAFGICNEQLNEQKDEIPDKYLEERSEEFFIPTGGMVENAEQVLDWVDEHSDDIDAFGDDGEGLLRARQIIRHEDTPLSIEYWEEIENYMARSSAQEGRNEIDDEHEGEPWKDAGYISYLAWGGDEGKRQADRVMNLVSEVDGEELSERKRELVSKMDVDAFGEAINKIEEDHEKRTDAIQTCQSILSGTLSKSTYYNWIEEAGLKQ